MEENNVKEILEKIDVYKEILSNMPVNTKKNKEKYIEEINKLEEMYKTYQKQVLAEFVRRYQEKMKEIIPDKTIEEIQNEIKDLQELYNDLNEMNTSYEKMKIDRIIYRIRKFYKENLDSINYEILKYIKLFEKVDIKLTVQDFQYSQYTSEYMQVFFEEKENIEEHKYSKKLKDTFEDIYWKCPDIIVHLELNLRYIYLNNESKIDKFYVKKQNEILKEGRSKENIKQIINNLKQKLYEKKSIDKYTIINRFFDGELKLADYKKEKVKSEYNKLLTVDMSELSDDRQKEVYDNIIKFLENLYEYKAYLNLKFILDDMKMIYKEKDNYKNIYNTDIKEITTLEKNLQKLSKNLEKKTVFGGKKSSEQNNAKYNELINEIREKYKKLDQDKIYNKVYEKINEQSTIYDIFYFANSFENYVRDTVIKYFPTVEVQEIDEKVKELEDFVNYQKIKIVNNINIQEEKDIALIIKDRYSLLNFNITKKDLDEDNIESLTKTLKKLKRDIDFKSAGMPIKEIEELCDIKELLEKEKAI